MPQNANINGVGFPRFALLSVVADVFRLIKCRELPTVTVNKCTKTTAAAVSPPFRSFIPPATCRESARTAGGRLPQPLATARLNSSSEVSVRLPQGVFNLLLIGLVAALCPSI